ncbi:MAG TPA: ImmA/IrrE family metallo-endopeptidase [Ktedonobacteraceae bacterium]|nr:ImmA/IrrE family metallo-endopeptidase [Ktedonobacteraceae bacterium]
MIWKKNSERINKAVTRLLQAGHISEPPVPVEQLAELCGVQIRYVPYEGQLASLLLWEDGHTVIGVNRLHSLTRQRFAIAHELGHLELHHHTGSHIDRHFSLPLHPLPALSPVESLECEASTFAAELLVPTPFLEHDLKGLKMPVDYDDNAATLALAGRYQVSSQLMSFRLVSMYFCSER